MRIAVLADTHVSRLQSIPPEIVDAISTVDLIFHAGDFTDLQTLVGLTGLEEVRAVQGNMDSMQLRPYSRSKTRLMCRKRGSE